VDYAVAVDAGMRMDVAWHVRRQHAQGNILVPLNCTHSVKMSRRKTYVEDSARDDSIDAAIIPGRKAGG
jgi:hypothetical protein